MTQDWQAVLTMMRQQKRKKRTTGRLDEVDYKGIMFTQEVMCNVQEKASIPSSWILLDSQSTVDVFCNAKMLTNVQEAKRHLTLHCNSGTVQVTMKGDLHGYGSVRYHPNGIANILSLNNVQKNARRVLIFVVAIQLIDYLLGVCFYCI
jgi:hypothetical protein